MKNNMNPDFRIWIRLMLQNPGSMFSTLMVLIFLIRHMTLPVWTTDSWLIIADVLLVAAVVFYLSLGQSVRGYRKTWSALVDHGSKMRLRPFPKPFNGRSWMRPYEKGFRRMLPCAAIGARTALKDFERTRRPSGRLRRRIPFFDF